MSIWVSQEIIDRLGPYCPCNYCAMLWWNPFRLLVDRQHCECIYTGFTTQDHLHRAEAEAESRKNDKWFCVLCAIC